MAGKLLEMALSWLWMVRTSSPWEPRDSTWPLKDMGTPSTFSAVVR